MVVGGVLGDQHLAFTVEEEERVGAREGGRPFWAEAGATMSQSNVKRMTIRGTDEHSIPRRKEPGKTKAWGTRAGRPREVSGPPA